MAGPKRVVIYGNGQMAELAWARLAEDDSRELVAFTVDGALVQESTFCGLPLVAFEEVARRYPPGSCGMHLAVGPVGCNRIRAERFDDARRLGYPLVSYVSPRALVARDVLPGENSWIADAAVVQSFVSLGANVHVGAGCIIGHHSVIHDHCFLAPGCVVAGSVLIGARSFLGANSTVRDRVQVGATNVVGAGATIVRNTAASSVHAAQEAIVLPIDSEQVRF